MMNLIDCITPFKDILNIVIGALISLFVSRHVFGLTHKKERSALIHNKAEEISRIIMKIEDKLYADFLSFAGLKERVLSQIGKSDFSTEHQPLMNKFFECIKEKNDKNENSRLGELFMLTNIYAPFLIRDLNEFFALHNDYIQKLSIQINIAMSQSEAKILIFQEMEELYNKKFALLKSMLGKAMEIKNYK